MAKVSVTKLMRKVNNLLGKDVLIAFHKGLSGDEYNTLREMMREGKVDLHSDMDGFVGFTADTGRGAWTSEGFTAPELERNCVTGKKIHI
jgi:hypothetical protein